MWLSRTLPTRENFAQAMASTVPPVEEAKAAGAAARVGNAASGSTKSVGDETDGTPTLVVVIDCRSKRRSTRMDISELLQHAKLGV